jgi:PAS domain S-box-containing protein/putative nucleotidyltransferase with HDIG domain
MDFVNANKPEAWLGECSLPNRPPSTTPPPLTARTTGSDSSNFSDVGEARYRALFQNLPVGMYRSTPSGRIVDANPALVQLLGYPNREALLRVPLQNLYADPTRRPTFVAEIERAGYVTDFEATLRRADGALVWVRTSARMERDADGQVSCYEGIVVDITEQRRNNERIRLQAAALEAAADGIVITDHTGTIEWVNPAFTRLTGYAPEEACGQSPRMLSSGCHDQAFYRRLWDTILSGELWHGETVNRRKDGTLYTEEQTIAPVVHATGQITHFVAIKHDITARKNAEQARERLVAILEATSDFVGTADPTGHVLYLNRGGRRMVGLSDDDDLKGRVIHDRYPEPSRSLIFTEAIPAAVRDGMWSGETEMLRRDGSAISVSQVILAHKTPSGEVEFLSTIARDISNRKRAETQIQRQFDRLASLHEVDAAISASLDLRAILNLLLDHVTAQLDVDAADVLLTDPATDMLKYAGGRGFRTPTFQHIDMSSNESHVCQVVRGGRTIVSDLRTVLKESARGRSLLAAGFMTYVAAPLITKDVVKGVLEVFSKNPLVPSREWLDLLNAFSVQAAIAVENATLLANLQRANMDLAAAYDRTIEGWSRALDLRDRETEGHSQRVADLAVALARALRVDEQELIHIRRGALLHDIGKMGIPDEILMKPGPLTEEEWAVMRRHPDHAQHLLANIAYLCPALDIPYCHHERWDGTGYPQGLRGEAIPMAARIFAVLDVWDALQSDRPYRQAWPVAKVREHIRKRAGTHFDPQVVAAFLGMISGNDQHVTASESHLTMPARVTKQTDTGVEAPEVCENLAGSKCPTSYRVTPL